MAMPKTKCEDCPKRGQCEDCRGWDEFRERLVDSLSRKLAKAVTERGVR